MWDLLGFSKTDELVYQHHLRHQGADSAQVARATGLPRDTVRACQSRLIGVGLLRREQFGEIRVTPNGPAIVAARLREELDVEHARRKSEIGRFQAEMTRLVNEHLLTTRHAAAPLIDHLPSAEAAAIRLTELISAARAELIRLEPDGDVRQQLSMIVSAELKAVDRGIGIRAIYPPAGLLAPATRHLIDHELRAGIAVR